MRCCLHPEERACASASAKSNARARASKDEDVRLGSPSCFETHRSAAEAEGVCASICAAMLLSMRARAKHQLAAVRNDRRGRVIVSGLLFTITFATPTCRPHRALKIVQGHTRADVPLSRRHIRTARPSRGASPCCRACVDATVARPSEPRRPDVRLFFVR
jgi:hypothetical protein